MEQDVRFYTDLEKSYILINNYTVTIIIKTLILYFQFLRLIMIKIIYKDKNITKRIFYDT